MNIIFVYEFKITILLFVYIYAGLFHRAIAQSGSAYNPWAMTHNATRQGHPQLAKRLGCLQNNVDDVIKCLRNVEAQHFAKISFEMIFRSIRVNK